MVKQRFVSRVALGHAGAAVQWARDLDKVCREEVDGHSGYRIWMPLTGPINVLVLESHYKDLADFSRIDRAFNANSNVMKQFRAGIEQLVPGTLPEVFLEESDDDFNLA